MKQNPEYFMNLAIEIAKEGISKGQTPFGAVIVKENEVLVKAHNVVWETLDITAHAEVTAIRKGCKTLETVNLNGCDIYSTCEPCPMCFSAIHWANINTIYYGATIEDAFEAGFHELSICNTTMQKLGKSEVKIVPNILQKECQELFTLWKQNQNHKVY